MRFIVGNVATQVVIGGKDNLLGLDLKEELRQYLRVKVKGANFSPNYGAGKWDGYKYFIAGDKFATGFLPMIIKFVGSLGVYVEIDDQRGPIPAMIDPIKDRLGDMIYRPYQREAIVAPAAKWIMGGGDHSSGDLLYWPRGVIDGATNAGKTLIIAGIYDNYNHVTKRALVTVHNDKLYKQHLKFFSEFFDVGEVTSKKYDPKDFTLAMSASLANKAKSSLNVQKDLKEFNMLFTDEGHRAAGTDYNQLLQKIDAPVRLLVSGSPLDNPDPIKNMIIMGLSGTSLFKVSKQELTEGGFSSTITVHIYLNNTRLKQFKPTYAEEIEHIVQYSEERLTMLLNAIEERIDKRILISYVNIAHGEWLYQAVKDYFPELRVEVTHGSDKQSDEKIEAFKRKEINILLTSMILQEGINIPTIQVLIRTEGGTSTIRTKQLSGRAERKELADGEEEHKEIIDFHDGMFDEIVGRHSRKRIADYKKQGFEVVLHYKANRNKPTL